MELKEKEIHLLTTISNLRFMSTQQIHSIHGYNGKYGANVTRRKLKSLEETGYLKSWQPSKYDQKVFYLSKKGAEEIALFHGIENMKTVTKSNTTLHQLMVTEIYVGLRNCNIGKIRRFILNQLVGVAIADAFIEYQVGDKNKLIFLEVDRATERISIIMDKLKQYQEACESGWWQVKFGIFPEVCFVTTSDTRKRSLLKLKEQCQFRVNVMTLDEFTVKPESII
ncbi:replication-relaxation family protein [Ammoniphilus resinae]|uniref:Replication-relaxation n=1 Tax=Ammoniphilus resinae TaxID=861532 RepID=A0ABS4GXP1_9BACL|nr:replication-relaxation family protein [Ammoniphilus resinae]MBP1935039.1 hypothetical protein [Ammoniphilus resinae]